MGSAKWQEGRWAAWQIRFFSTPHPTGNKDSNSPLAIGKKLWATNSDKEVLASELEEKRKGGDEFL